MGKVILPSCSNYYWPILGRFIIQECNDFMNLVRAPDHRIWYTYNMNCISIVNAGLKMMETLGRIDPTLG